MVFSPSESSRGGAVLGGGEPVVNLRAWNTDVPSRLVRDNILRGVVDSGEGQRFSFQIKKPPIEL